MATMIVKKEAQAREPVPQKPEAITQSSVFGEDGTGYEGPDGGDFACWNCEYFDQDTVSCGQKEMMAKSKRPKIESGRVVVHPEGCCEYVSRKSTAEDAKEREEKKD